MRKEALSTPGIGAIHGRAPTASTVGMPRSTVSPPLVVADDQRAVAEARRARAPAARRCAPAAPRRSARPSSITLCTRAITAGPSISTVVAHAELLAAACPVRDLGCPDQGLRRDAPDVDSGAAERLGLDHGDARAQPAGAHRAGDPAHAAADHDELGRVRLELRHAAGQTSSGATRAIVSSTSSRRPCSASRRSTPSASTRYCPTCISGGE